VDLYCQTTIGTTVPLKSIDFSINPTKTRRGRRPLVVNFGHFIPFPPIKVVTLPPPIPFPPLSADRGGSGKRRGRVTGWGKGNGMKMSFYTAWARVLRLIFVIFIEVSLVFCGTGLLLWVGNTVSQQVIIALKYDKNEI